jgi:O-antigen ligase
LNYVYLALVAAAFLVVESLFGGVKLLFSLPAYGLLGIAAVLTILSWKPQKAIARPQCLICSAIFFSYIVGRCWFSPIEYLARRDFFMVLGSLMVYLITALLMVKSQHRMQLLGVLLVVAIAQTAVGFIQFKNGDNFMLFGYQRYDYQRRASGQYGCPNHLAGYLEVVALFGLSLVVWSKSRHWVKILAAYASLVALAGLVVTGSRGGYISTVFSLLVFVALSLLVVKFAFPEYFAKAVFAALTLVIVVAVTIPLLITSDVIRNRASQLITNDGRTNLWKAALDQNKLNPVFGTGSGTYLYYGRKFRNPEVQHDPIRVHNDYLDLLAEYGWLGVAGMVLFLASHVGNGIRTYRRLVTKNLQFGADWRSNSLALNIGCLCAVAAYLSHSVVDFNLHIPANSMLMAFVFGILANPGLETFQETNADKIINTLFRCVLPLLGVTVLVFVTRLFPGEYFAEKARVAVRDKNYFDAVSAAKKGIEREKKNPDLYYYLGEARRNFADSIASGALRAPFYKLAVESFQQAIDLFPQDVRLLLIQGWTLDALGRHDEAGDFFRRAVEWDPKSNQVRQSSAIHEDPAGKKAAKSQEGKEVAQ